MRPLRRPMFRTGGPIGEGVMHGMNGLQNGGTVRHMNGLANGGMPDKRGLVDGPGNYGGKKGDFGRKVGYWTLGGGGTLASILKGLWDYGTQVPMKNGGIASFANGGRTIAGGNQIGTPMGNRTGFANPIDPRPKVAKWGMKKLLPKVGIKPGFLNKPIQWSKDKWNAYKFPPRMQPTTPNAPGVTSATKARDMWHRSGQYFKKHPYLSTLGPTYAAFTDPVKGTFKAVANTIPEIAQFGAEALTPGDAEKYLPPDKWWKWKSDVKWKPGDVRGDNKKLPPAPVVPEETGTKEEKDAYTKAFKKEQKDEQLNKIYKLLGVDRAKKNAASKALIDMSRYIDEGGKDVISKKNLGSTISKAIGAFDKRLDKVDQLKEAAGLMIAKGEIEKEIYGAKPGTQLKAAQDYQSQFGGSLKDAYKALGIGKKDMSTTISEALIKGSNLSTPLVEAAYRSETGAAPVLTTSSTDFKKWQKDNDDKNELEYVKTISDRKPGSYIIGTRVVIVDEKLNPSFYY